MPRGRRCILHNIWLKRPQTSNMHTCTRQHTHPARPASHQIRPAGQPASQPASQPTTNTDAQPCQPTTNTACPHARTHFHKHTRTHTPTHLVFCQVNSSSTFHPRLTTLPCPFPLVRPSAVTVRLTLPLRAPCSPSPRYHNTAGATGHTYY